MGLATGAGMNVLQHGNCAAHPIFRPDLRPQIGCELAHRRIGHGLFDGSRKPLDREPPAWNRLWSGPQFGHTLPPERLVTEERNDD